MSGTPIVLAAIEDAESFEAMARETHLVVNTMGPFAEHGEAVVKAAIAGRANYIDVTGEPSVPHPIFSLSPQFLELIQEKYDEAAREAGIYVVGACGTDSIPADLGVLLLKRNFHGDLDHVDGFPQNVVGPSVCRPPPPRLLIQGYTASATTLESLIHGFSQDMKALSKRRRLLMPVKMPRSVHWPKPHSDVWALKEVGLEGAAYPSFGTDRSIVQRSQCHDFVFNGQRPVRGGRGLRGRQCTWMST